MSVVLKSGFKLLNGSGLFLKIVNFLNLKMRANLKWIGISTIEDILIDLSWSNEAGLSFLPLSLSLSLSPSQTHTLTLVWSLPHTLSLCLSHSLSLSLSITNPHTYTCLVALSLSLSLFLFLSISQNIRFPTKDKPKTSITSAGGKNDLLDSLFLVLLRSRVRDKKLKAFNTGNTSFKVRGNFWGIQCILHKYPGRSIWTKQRRQDSLFTSLVDQLKTFEFVTLQKKKKYLSYVSIWNFSPLVSSFANLSSKERAADNIKLIFGFSFDVSSPPLMDNGSIFRNASGLVHWSAN